MVADTLLTMFEYAAENETMSVKQDKRKRLHLPKNEKSYLVGRKIYNKWRDKEIFQKNIVSMIACYIDDFFTTCRVDITGAIDSR